MKNKHIKVTHISERKTREIIRLFSLDIEAEKTAELTDVSRQTINKFHIRQRIAELCEAESPFTNGEIELDENYFGARRVRGIRGRGAKGKTAVFGMLRSCFDFFSREFLSDFSMIFDKQFTAHSKLWKVNFSQKCKKDDEKSPKRSKRSTDNKYLKNQNRFLNVGAKVYTQIIKRVSASELMPIITGKADHGVLFYTDGFKTYDGLVNYGYKKHYRVKHGENEFTE